MATKRRSYPAGYKLEVVKYASGNGNRAAERKFGVSEKLVRDWRKKEILLTAMKKTKKANRGLKARWPKLEQRVQAWVLEQRAAGRSCTAARMRLHAQAVAKDMNIDDFAGGPSWCYRFMQRSRLSFRAKTTKSQKLQADCKSEVDFYPEFDEKHEELRISSVYSLRGGENTFIPPPAPPPAPVPQPSPPPPPGPGNAVGCGGCSKVLLKGETALQRKGSTQLFCSTVCLTGYLPPTSKARSCHQCLKEISQSEDMIMTPIDATNYMHFCSQLCLSVFNRRKQPEVTQPEKENKTAQSGQSKVWSYYTKDISGDVVCNICAASVSQGSRKLKLKNTTNLWQHLKGKHKDAYEKAQEKAAQAQPTLTQMFDRTTKWSPNDPKSKEMDKLIMEMIATDVLPYAVVEGEGFKRLLAKAEYRYTPKSEKYFRNQLMHEMYSQVARRVKELLSVENAGKNIVFTTDCWSGSTEALMSLTAHFIDKNWERVQIVLNVKAMFGSHTGQYISETFLTLLKEWDIDVERVHLVLRDSGANMIKGTKLVEMPGLSCTAHDLQLVINDGLTSQTMVGDILAKMKIIATHFNHSVVAQQQLSVIQEVVGVPHHSIIQAVPTRWNSTLHMLARMLEQKRAVTTYSRDLGHFTCPTAEEWDMAANLVETLTPLEEISCEMSRGDSSASCIIPCVAVLRRLLESEGPNSGGIKALRKTMLMSLEERFSRVQETKELVLACLLDPRYKERPFSPETLARARAWLSEEVKTTPAATQADTMPAEADSHDNGEGDPEKTRVEEAQNPSILDSLYDTMLASVSQDKAPEGVLEELERYLREPVIERKRGNPLEWWRSNSCRFNELSALARKYLCCPASSEPSERSLSIIGNIYGEKCSSFKEENAENLCFLHYNLPLLKWQY